VITVVFYAFITGFSLLLGAIAASLFNFRQKVVAAIMAFGSGTLICALTFGLMEEAFKHGGFDAVVFGFLLGGVSFIAGDFWIHQAGGRSHRRHQIVKSEKEISGPVIALGSVLDGIPESVALGVSLLNPKGIGLVMVAAIFLSNLPEAISSTNGFTREGISKRQIFLIWFIVATAVTLTTIASFLFLGDLKLNTLAAIESFAAGAILAMLADSMMPEAYEEGGVAIGLLTMLGFLATFIVSKL
jgi:ZIP family zinc transporter